jgi:hypothetical protein
MQKLARHADGMKLAFYLCSIGTSSYEVLHCNARRAYHIY